MQKNRKIINKFVSFIRDTKERIVATVTILFLMTSPVSASTIANSKLATGTEKLIKDATAWLLVVAPLVTVAALIYFAIRKGISDEMDHKKWNSRMITAVICGGIAVLASVIVNLVMDYYK